MGSPTAAQNLSKRAREGHCFLHLNDFFSTPCCLESGRSGNHKPKHNVSLNLEVKHPLWLWWFSFSSLLGDVEKEGQMKTGTSSKVTGTIFALLDENTAWLMCINSELHSGLGNFIAIMLVIEFSLICNCLNVVFTYYLRLYL